MSECVCMFQEVYYSSGWLRAYTKPGTIASITYFSQGRMFSAMMSSGTFSSTNTFFRMKLTKKPKLCYR